MPPLQFNECRQRQHFVLVVVHQVLKRLDGFVLFASLELNLCEVFVGQAGRLFEAIQSLGRFPFLQQHAALQFVDRPLQHSDLFVGRLFGLVLGRFHTFGILAVKPGAGDRDINGDRGVLIQPHETSFEGRQLRLATVDIPLAEVGTAEHPDPLNQFRVIFDGAEILRPRIGDQGVPHFELRVALIESQPTEVGALATTREIVVLGVTRQLDRVPRQCDGVLGPPQVLQVADQPFVVVGEVVDGVRQDHVAHHVGMVGPCRGFLVPGGVEVLFEIGIRVARHVPHVGDPRCRQTAFFRRVHRLPGLVVVPQVDPVVMHRVQGIDGECGVHQRIDGEVTRNRQFRPSLPQRQAEERPRFTLLGELVDDVFQRGDVVLNAALALFVVIGFGLVPGIQGVDIHLFALAHRPLTFDRFRDERLGPLVIIDVGQGHSPIGHRTIVIQMTGLAKRPLGFEIPEAVQLADPLVEVRLRLRIFCRDRERHVSGRPH